TYKVTFSIFTSHKKIDMTTTDLSRLQYYIDLVPQKWSRFTEVELAYRAEEHKWSKKEILGSCR
ncbi:MAG: hypothetical protein ACRCVU_02215, partial [Flavobacterium sp.]